MNDPAAAPTSDAPADQTAIESQEETIRALREEIQNLARALDERDSECSRAHFVEAQALEAQRAMFDAVSAAFARLGGSPDDTKNFDDYLGWIERQAAKAATATAPGRPADEAAAAASPAIVADADPTPKKIFALGCFLYRGAPSEAVAAVFADAFGREKAVGVGHVFNADMLAPIAEKYADWLNEPAGGSPLTLYVATFTNYLEAATAAVTRALAAGLHLRTFTGIELTLTCDKERAAAIVNAAATTTPTGELAAI